MSDIYILGGAVAAVVAFIAAVFRYGRRAGKREEEHDELQEDVETARRIDRVRASDDAAAAADRLRERRPGGDL